MASWQFPPEYSILGKTEVRPRLVGKNLVSLEPTVATSREVELEVNKLNKQDFFSVVSLPHKNGAAFAGAGITAALGSDLALKLTSAFGRAVTEILPAERGRLGRSFLKVNWSPRSWP